MWQTGGGNAEGVAQPESRRIMQTVRRETNCTGCKGPRKSRKGQSRMRTLRYADCGELFDETTHQQCWREPFDKSSGAGIDEHGSPVEVPVCRDCLYRDWLARDGIFLTDWEAT